MKSFIAAIAIMLLAGSSAFGFQGYYYSAAAPVAPAPVVAYYPPAPWVTYYAPLAVVAAPVVAPVVRFPGRYYVASPVMVPAPVVAPVYVAPVVVYPRVFVPGQPVRNLLRAVAP